MPAAQPSDNSTKKKNPLSGRALIDYCATELFARKAVNIVLMELKGLSEVCDSFLIATCQSETQMRAILQGLQRALRNAGIQPIGNDAGPGARWAVLDLGELMVHLFEESHRAHFSLERLYKDAPREELKAEDFQLEERTVESVENEFI